MTKVGFNIAKLAKEKGYTNGSYATFTHYHKKYVYDGDPTHPESHKKNEVRSDNSMFHINHSPYDFSGKHYTIYEMPTQSKLQAWLRDNHLININVVFKPNIKKWDFVPADMKLDGKGYTKFYFEYFTLHKDRRFDKYEDALEEGLLEALKLIPNISTNV